MTKVKQTFRQGILSTIRVLDLSRLLPGPYCSMILADHGADVLAIEDRRFLADDLFFGDVYRNKRHMTLNLKTARGREIFFRLAKDADVVIEGFRPGVVSRLGVDYNSIKKINAGIIYCSITGYGQYGPGTKAPGHDVNYLSRAGILGQIGEADGAPTIPAIQIADIAAGGMNGVIGILLALIERQNSGVGQHIDISMSDGLLGLLTLSRVLEEKTGMKQSRSSSLLSHRYGCYNTYETKDGRYIAIGAVEARFWQNLCTILGVEEFTSLQYDETNREKIIHHLRSLFKAEPLSYWEELLAEADVCYSKVQDMDEVMTDPLFTERGMIAKLQSEHGKKNTFGIAVKLSRTPGSLRSGPQKFGEATRQVLNELGYGTSDIDSLFADGVV